MIALIQVQQGVIDGYSTKVEAQMARLYRSFNERYRSSLNSEIS